MGSEGLLEGPSDLEFWHSTDIGFLTKGGQELFSSAKELEALQCVVTDELAVPIHSKLQSLDLVGRIAERARMEPNVLSFWVLERKPTGDSFGHPENNLYVFMRFKTKAACDAYRYTTSQIEWEAVGGLVTNRRTTTWEEAGIGFLGR